MIASYGAGFEGVKIDRILKAGDVIEWEGYKLHIDWMPGQTEFGNCLWLELDGKRIAFTGDNLFGNPADPAQNGHECVVARNSAITRGRLSRRPRSICRSSSPTSSWAPTAG